MWKSEAQEVSRPGSWCESGSATWSSDIPGKSLQIIESLLHVIFPCLTLLSPTLPLYYYKLLWPTRMSIVYVYALTTVTKQHWWNDFFYFFKFSVGGTTYLKHDHVIKVSKPWKFKYIIFNLTDNLDALLLKHKSKLFVRLIHLKLNLWTRNHNI